MSGDFQDEIECLGIEASPSFVREPQGNGVAERFIQTLKDARRRTHGRSFVVVPGEHDERGSQLFDGIEGPRPQ